MKRWPKNPSIYEINTWVWLDELGQKYGRPITLDTVPSEEWDFLASFGFHALWLMGVWERSPWSVAISSKNPQNIDDFSRALKDFRPKDNVGSAYSVRQYVVDKHLGGDEGLAVVRRELTARRLRLILDFVPNHVALDHPWVTDNPDYFIQGNVDDVKRDPISFVQIGALVFACGRDPYFPAWQDVLQLNAFHDGLRKAAKKVLSKLAEQCDGVRCDMAMLMLNQVFEGTWVQRAGKRPQGEYWVDIISTIKKVHPGFLFMAEAYWDLERELQQQGFDYCYDKRLYDRLERDTAPSILLHLAADLSYQEKLVRFIENHDEPRASLAFSPPKHRAAAVIVATLPGAKLFHEGQLEGRKVKLPVFLGRRPVELPDAELQTFYRVLVSEASLAAARDDVVWQLCERMGSQGNETYKNLMAWCWRSSEKWRLSVVNFSSGEAGGRVRVPDKILVEKSWWMTDIFTGKKSKVKGIEMCSTGIYIELPAWGYHIFHFNECPATE